MWVGFPSDKKNRDKIRSRGLVYRAYCFFIFILLKKLKTMDINSKITTVLTYQDVALISIALGLYDKKLTESDFELLKHSKDLVNRLGNELYSHPKRKR